MKNLDILDWCCIIIIGLLLLCLAPMPYGYYSIVRVVVMCLSVYIGYLALHDEKKGIMIVCVGVAILFQPFIKFAIGRTIWHIMDIVVAVIILVYIIYRNKK